MSIAHGQNLSTVRDSKSRTIRLVHITRHHSTTMHSLLVSAEKENPSKNKSDVVFCIVQDTVDFRLSEADRIVFNRLGRTCLHPHTTATSGGVAPQPQSIPTDNETEALPQRACGINQSWASTEAASDESLQNIPVGSSAV